LPETARAEVVVLLARLIARGVLVEDGPGRVPAASGPDRGLRGEQR